MEGTLIIKEEPYCHVVMNQHRLSNCSYCLKEEKLQICTKCQTTYYCGKKCQKKDWHQGHKQECQSLLSILPQYRPKIPGTVLLMARIINKLTTEKDLDASSPKDKDFYKASWIPTRQFQDLLSHKEKIKTDLERMDCFITYGHALQRLLPPQTFSTLSADYLLDFFGKVMINTYSILDQDFKPVAHGIYLNASYLDHSCYPNAGVTFDGSTISICSIQNLPPGEAPSQKNVFIRYMDPLEVGRKEKLQNLYYFTCQCSLCKLDGEYYFEQGKITPEAVQSLEVPSGPLVLIQNSKCVEDPHKDLLGRLPKYYPVSTDPSYNAKLKEHMDACIEAREDWPKAYACGLAFYQGTLEYKIYYPPNDPVLAMHALKMAKIARILKGFKEADDWLSKAKRILELLHPTRPDSGDRKIVEPYMIRCMKELKLENDLDLQHVQMGDAFVQPRN